MGNGNKVLKTACFDTYAEDSTNLELFLEGLGENSILIVVGFDEISQRLNFENLNLKFNIRA